MKISISPTRHLTDRLHSNRSNDGSLSGKTGTGENKPPGIFIVNTIQENSDTSYTVTVTMTRDGQVWSRTLQFTRSTSVGSSTDLIEPTPKTSLQRFEPVEIIYLEATEPKPAPQQQERTPVERAPVPKGAEVAPTVESTEPQLASGNGKESIPYSPTYVQRPVEQVIPVQPVDLQIASVQPMEQVIPEPSPVEQASYKMTFPQGVNSLHLPCKPRKSFFFTDLVNLLGDVNVNSISALRPTVQAWTVVTSSHSVHNEWISRYRGFVADMQHEVTVDLTREPAGHGYDMLYLKEGNNLIGVPRESPQLEIVSDFFVVFDSVMWVELIEDGLTRTRYHPSLPDTSTLDSDTGILPTRGYMLMSLEDDEYAIWGNAWGDVINQLPQQEE